MSAKTAATHSSSVRLNCLNPPAFGFAVLMSNKNNSPSLPSTKTSIFVGLTFIISPARQTALMRSISPGLSGVPCAGGQIGQYRLNHLKRARADIIARLHLRLRVREIRLRQRDGDRLKNARPEIRVERMNKRIQRQPVCAEQSGVKRHRGRFRLVFEKLISQSRSQNIFVEVIDSRYNYF